MKLIDVVTSPWAIMPDKLLEIRAIYETHLRGEKIDLSAVEKRIGKPLHSEPKGYTVQDGVAVLPIEGVIAKRMSLLTQISGGVSSALAAQDFQAAIADPAVEAIILQIDSPGGAVDGTQELANLIYGARGVKPVVALADGTMASAAYWIGAAADKVFITSDTTLVGSIGVVATHVDVSRREDAMGVKTTEITAGKFKRIASEYAPLTEEGRASIQDRVDHIYSIFVGEVAKFRGVSEETALNEMADGRVFIGQQAVQAGLVDGVSTLAGLMASMKGGMVPQRKSTTTTIDGGVPSATTTPNQGDDMELTMETLKAEHADLVKALLDEGREAGAAAERQRIQDVEAQSLPGHEKLVASLKFDGKTTGPEAALAVLNAERERRGKALADIAGQAQPPLPHAAAPATEPSKNDDTKDLPLEERAKAIWEKTPALRTEFSSFETYLAYERASAAGQVKTFALK